MAVEALTTRILDPLLRTLLDLTVVAVEATVDTRTAEVRTVELLAAIAQANTSLEVRPTNLALAQPCTNESSDLLAKNNGHDHCKVAPH